MVPSFQCQVPHSPLDSSPRAGLGAEGTSGGLPSPSTPQGHRVGECGRENQRLARQGPHTHPPGAAHYPTPCLGRTGVYVELPN